MEKKDNKAIEKVDNLRNNLNIEEQLKDLRNDLKTTKRSIRSISNPNLDIDRLKKPPIIFKPSNLKVKIPKNAFYIVIKNGIYIYSKDLQKAYVFQKIYERYPKI